MLAGTHSEHGVGDVGIPFAGPGEIRALCRAFDWATSPLGAAEPWPPALRTAVDTCLGSPFASFIWWGPELIQLYNDAALAILRGKHPHVFAVPAREAWADVWGEVGPLAERVLANRDPVHGEDMSLVSHRGAPSEFARFTFSFSALRDATGNAAGMYITATENTRRMDAERRLGEVTESDARYHALFETMDEGFALCELVRDDRGQVVDYRFLELNRAFESRMGLRRADVLGRLRSEVLPASDTSWLELYGGVVATGEPVHTEHYSPALARWFGVRAFARGGDRFVVLFDDVTERKQAEETLRASEARQKFMLALSDVLRDLHDPEEVQASAARVLGEHLGADRAYYVEVDEARSEFVVEREWRRDGAPSHARRYPLDDWPMPWLAHLRPWVVTDVDVDPAMPDDQRASYRANDIGACVLVPFIRGGRLVATLVVNQRAPRDWTPSEVAMVGETAERTWAAVERARVEKALLASGTRYRALFESMDEAYMVVEMIADEAGRWCDFRILEVNAAFVAHTAMPDPVGRTATELLGAAIPQWAEKYGRVVDTGEPVRFEEAELLLGRVFDVNAFRLGDPGSYRVAVLFTDITARKHAEAAIRSSAAFDAYRVTLTDALRGTPDPVEAQGAAMRALGDYLGASRVMYGEAVDGSSDSFRNHREFRRDPAMPISLGTHRWDDFGAYVATEMRAGRTLVVNDVREHPGHLPEELDRYEAAGIRAYLAVPLVREERIAAYLAVNHATTRAWTTEEIALIEETAERTWAAVERARAEAALEASEARLRLALDVAELGTWTWDLMTGAGDLDARCAEIVGLPTGAVTIAAAQLARIHPDDFTATQATAAAGIAAGAPFDLHYRVLFSDSSVHHVASRAHVVTDAEGRPVRLVGTNRDVTAEYEAVTERERLLRDAESSRDAAQAANRAKSEFLAVMSHELRTPLNAIGGYAELIELGIHGPVTDAQRTALARIQVSQRHLLGLIAGVLDYSRVEAGAVHYKLQDVLLAEAVAEAETLVAPQLHAKGLGYSWSGAPPGLAVQADREKLQQILLNLVSNAIKFTQPRDGEFGRIEVSCTVDTGDVAEGRGRVHLHVRDTGDGIAADQLDRIFEPFVQVDQHLTRPHAGVGLGLAISRDLARGMGGDLTVQSDAGRGSTFTLDLRVSQSA